MYTRGCCYLASTGPPTPLYWTTRCTYTIQTYYTRFATRQLSDFIDSQRYFDQLIHIPRSQIRLSNNKLIFIRKVSYFPCPEINHVQYSHN